MIFVNFTALLIVTGIFILTWVLHRHNSARFADAAFTTWVATFALTLFYTVHALSNLADLSAIGSRASFVLLANAYAALLALISRVSQVLCRCKNGSCH